MCALLCPHIALAVPPLAMLSTQVKLQRAVCHISLLLFIHSKRLDAQPLDTLLLSAQAEGVQ